MPLIDSSHNNVSILFESLSYKTGGNSFLIQTQNDALNVYMEFMDALREIQRRSEANAPVLIYENEITEEALSLEANGEFVIDQHVGNQTEFQVYTMGSSADNGFVKDILIRDTRNEKYSDISDRLEYHYLSVFQVPFDEVSLSFFLSPKI